MRLARLGMTLRHALGPTADAARALARYQTRPAPDEGQAIRRLPVAALELEPEATTALVRAGLKTIGDLASRPMRSEEHTSELQSLMRNSSAVFCLKKKHTHRRGPLASQT